MGQEGGVTGKCLGRECRHKMEQGREGNGGISVCQDPVSITFPLLRKMAGTDPRRPMETLPMGRD